MRNGRRIRGFADLFLGGEQVGRVNARQRQVATITGAVIVALVIAVSFLGHDRKVDAHEAPPRTPPSSAIDPVMLIRAASSPAPVDDGANAPITTPTAPVATAATSVAPTTTVAKTAPTTRSTARKAASAPKAPSDGDDGNDGRFSRPAGAALPSERECEKQVQKHAEVRGANTGANHTKPNRSFDFGLSWGSDPKAGDYGRRVTGRYVGTTDEIIQWAACKWGFDVDVVRAQAMAESSWKQGAVSGMTDDATKCFGGMLPEPTCPTAFGILQIQADSHPGTYPWSASSTAFNLDYSLALERACYDGHIWLGTQTKADAWGCVGVHNSGRWYDDKAKRYIAKVRAAHTARAWPQR